GPGAGAGGAGVQGAGATGSGTGTGGGAGGGGAGWVVRVRWRPGGAQAGRRQIGSQARKDRSSESRISDLLGMDAAWEERRGIGTLSVTLKFQVFKSS